MDYTKIPDTDEKTNRVSYKQGKHTMTILKECILCPMYGVITTVDPPYSFCTGMHKIFDGTEPDSFFRCRRNK